MVAAVWFGGTNVDKRPWTDGNAFSTACCADIEPRLVTAK